MINAIGWSMSICDDDHIHIELIAQNKKPFGEIVLHDSDDIKQFCDDMAECIHKLKLRKMN